MRFKTSCSLFFDVRTIYTVGEPENLCKTPGELTSGLPRQLGGAPETQRMLLRSFQFSIAKKGEDLKLKLRTGRTTESSGSTRYLLILRNKRKSIEI